MHALGPRESLVLENSFEKLPPELLQSIFLMMSTKTRCVCLRVSKSWGSTLTADSTLWRSINFSAAQNTVRAEDLARLVSLAKGDVRELDRALPEFRITLRRC